MTEYPWLPPDQVEQMLEQCWAALAEVSKELADSGRQLLAGLTPQQWPVEWQLPWWLAGSFDLPSVTWQALTVCNLLGLGYVRVQDRLAESRGLAVSVNSEIVLAGAFYEAALAELAELFLSTPVFWQRRRKYMTEWLQSLLEGDRPSRRPFAMWQQQDFARLAWRGAPLKITATGACLLAGRPDAMQPLTAALDHMLIAQVLLDHADDWREDLAGERFNAFVACASDVPQTRANLEISQRRVLGLLMLDDPNGVYFSLVDAHINEAKARAAEVGCMALVAYLAAFQTEARAGVGELVRAARAQLRSAVGQLLAPTDGKPDRR
jgi:hypothetical protein